MKYTNKFHVGQSVAVTAYADDDFHDFTGTIKEIREYFVLVRDQDDDVWCVGPAQLSETEADNTRRKKRFIVPAIIVVDGDETLTKDEAEKRSNLMQDKANEESRMLFLGGYLMLDEKRPTVEAPIHPEETELPGTYPQPDLASIREKIQEDLRTFLDGLPASTLDQVCQIVVDNFKNPA